MTVFEMTVWVLIVLLANGETAMVPQANELACDSAQRAIERHVAETCVAPGSPVPIAAACRLAEVLP